MSCAEYGVLCRLQYAGTIGSFGAVGSNRSRRLTSPSSFCNWPTALIRRLLPIVTARPRKPVSRPCPCSASDSHPYG